MTEATRDGGPATSHSAQSAAADGLGDQLVRLRHQQQATSAAPVLRVLGGIYVVLSGTIFLEQDVEPALAGTLWAITAVVGLGSIAAGRWVGRHALSPARLDAVCGGFGLLFIAHGLLSVWLFDDAGQSTYILTLLAAGGFFLLSRRAVATFMAASLIGWALVAGALGLPWDSRENGYVLAGAFVGIVAHLARNRSLRRTALAGSQAMTTLQASEERFRNLAETATDAILLVDATGRLTYLNPAGLKLFGLRADAAAGSFLSHLASSGGAETEPYVGTREVQGRRRDGTTFPAELSLARNQRGGEVVYTGILRDITDRQRAAAEVKAAAEREAEVDKLRAMNEFKTHFLNMAAHELNTPLTPLRLQLHLLKAGQMGDLNERQSRAVTVLDRNVLRLTGLVGEILEVARLQSGRLKLSVGPVALDEVVDEVLGSFADAARGVGVDLSFAGVQNFTVRADRNRLTQVMFNLVSNALKFTPAGGRIVVEATTRGDMVEVAVIDSGMGLGPDQIEKLFQPFVQVHDPMLVTATGTGLGLYISKGLVEAQGGTIAVTSAGPGHGCAFRFTLPASSAAQTSVVAIALEEDPIIRRLRELI